MEIFSTEWLLSRPWAHCLWLAGSAVGCPAPTTSLLTRVGHARLVAWVLSVSGGGWTVA